MAQPTPGFVIVDPPAAGRYRLNRVGKPPDRTEKTEMTLVDDRTQQLIDALATCVAKCEACTQECARQGDATLADCISLCADCSTLCQACMTLLARGSQFSNTLCLVCADACDGCAKECEDKGMTECAEACRATAKACRQMATA